MNILQHSKWDDALKGKHYPTLIKIINSLSSLNLFKIKSIGIEESEWVVISHLFCVFERANVIGHGH